MNSEPNKRSWLQIHLSTAIVLMFVAGVLVRANVNGTQFLAGYSHRIGKPEWVSTYQIGKHYGWPLVAVTDEEYKTVFENPHLEAEVPPDYLVECSRIAVDALVAMMILLVVWYILERLNHHI